MSAAVYAEVVAATIARLRAAEARPPVEPIKPDASRVTHYCVACDLSWRGPAPCWSCDGVAVEHQGLTTNERSLWALSNAHTVTFPEGEQ